MFFFNDTATTEIYTLSLHDALPIFRVKSLKVLAGGRPLGARRPRCIFEESRLERMPPRAPPSCKKAGRRMRDRKSTRLNSSHANISYAVFCLNKKKIKPRHYLDLCI